MLRAVLDTNVIVAALKSNRGASHEVLLRMDAGSFQPVVSVPLVAEYEDVLLRPSLGIRLSQDQIGAVLDRICQLAHKQEIHFLWRPYLPDPKDDMVFEVALAASATCIVTFNLSDFELVKQFDIQVLSPAQFLMHHL